MTLSAQDRARRIKIILFDVDGVLTDGGIWIFPAPAAGSQGTQEQIAALEGQGGYAISSANMVEAKGFNAHDGTAISLARLVMAQTETRLSVLAEPRVLSCPADLHQNDLAEQFDKYNLHALPVVDAEGRMVGVVQADHVISLLRDKL